MNYPENKIILQKYIDDNESALTGETSPVMLHGKRTVLDVYKVPLELLVFNIKNGRFKSEYLEAKRKNGGRDLDPTNPEDAKELQKLLLELNEVETSRTMDDIRNLEQKIPGIMTWDGAVIDGNRRLSILQKLCLEDPAKFSKMLVARLPETVEQADLWKLEAGIQLGKDEIVKYKPINELLKLKEGIDADFTVEEIVNTLYGVDSEKEVQKKLACLDLVEKYLLYIGHPSQYSKVDDKIQYFIEAQTMIPELDKLDTTDEKRYLNNTIFEIIRRGKSFDDIRLIKKMIKEPESKAVFKLLEIGEFALTVDRQVEVPMGDDDSHSADLVDTLWVDAKEEQRAIDNVGNIPRLLANALTNLEKIDLTDSVLKEDQCAEIIQKLIRNLESLKDL